MKKSCLMLSCLCLAGCAGGGGGEPSLTVQVQNLTDLAIVGQPVTLLVNILRGNRVATDYEGIVSFSSSLDGTVVPWPFQVLASNGGLKSFVDEFTFPESGTHTITVTAEGVPSEATLDIEVFSNPAPAPKPPVFTPPSGSKIGTLIPLDPPLTNAATVGVAVADFDQDGDVDVLLGMLRGETLFFANDGKAQFTVRKAFDDGASLLRVGDLDGNGSPDVAYISGPDIKVRFNDGKGTFSAGPALPLATVATELEVGDIDGDGDLDLVVAGSALTVWINNGSGGFSNGGAVAEKIRAATLADLDADGDLDLLTNRGFYRNDGTGSFSFVGGLQNR